MVVVDMIPRSTPTTTTQSTKTIPTTSVATSTTVLRPGVTFDTVVNDIATSSTAYLGRSQQHRMYFDSVHKLYWYFYCSGVLSSSSPRDNMPLVLVAYRVNATDDGATWGPEHTVSQAACSQGSGGRIDFAFSGTTVYMVLTNTTGAISAFYTQHGILGYGTINWMGSEVTTSTGSCSANDNPDLVIASDGTLWVSMWVMCGASGTWTYEVWKSTSGGASWTLEDSVVPQSGGNSFIEPIYASGITDGLVFGYAGSTQGTDKAITTFFVITTNGGSTWTQAVETPATYLSCQVAGTSELGSSVAYYVGVTAVGYSNPLSYGGVNFWTVSSTDTLSPVTVLATTGYVWASIGSDGSNELVVFAGSLTGGLAMWTSSNRGGTWNGPITLFSSGQRYYSKGGTVPIIQNGDQYFAAAWTYNDSLSSATGVPVDFMFAEANAANGQISTLSGLGGLQVHSTNLFEFSLGMVAAGLVIITYGLAAPESGTPRGGRRK